MKVGSLILILMLLAVPLWAEDKVLYTDEQGKQILNLDNVDYFIYKGKRLTFSGLVNALLDERRGKYTQELKKNLLRELLK